MKKLGFSLDWNRTAFTMDEVNKKQYKISFGKPTCPDIQIVMIDHEIIITVNHLLLLIQSG